MTTFNNVSNDEFKKSASEFFQATQTPLSLSPEQVDSGHKALVLLYFGHDDDWTERQVNEAVMIIELAGNRCLKSALAHAGLPL